MISELFHTETSIVKMCFLLFTCPVCHLKGVMLYQQVSGKSGDVKQLTEQKGGDQIYSKWQLGSIHASLRCSFHVV